MMGETYLIVRFSIELIDEHEGEETDKQQTYSILNTFNHTMGPLLCLYDSRNHCSILPPQLPHDPKAGCGAGRLGILFSKMT